MKQSNVSLVLRADTSAFVESIRQAEQEFSSRFKKMGSTSHAHSNRIKDDFTGIGLGAKQIATHLKQAARQLTLVTGAATGLGYLGRRLLDVADRTANAADRVGITTGLLQELRFAASQTGVPIEKLETSLERFTKRLGEAASGSGAAAKTYQGLGVSVLEADGSLRDTGAVLNDVADALAGMDSQAERAAATTALFGREGIAMTLLLGRGAKGIEEYRKQAQQLGIVIDEKVLRQAELAADKFDILASVIKAQAVTAFVQLAPSMINFSQQVVATIPRIKEFLSTLYDLKDSFLFIAKALMVNRFINFTTGLVDASKALIAASASATKFSTAISLISKSLKGIGLTLAVMSAIESISLFKEQLELKQNVKIYLQSQQELIDSHSQYAHAARLSASEFSSLAKSEQQIYLERLKQAQSFWQARLTLESRVDFQSKAALYAAKENRLYLEKISMVESALKQRLDLERSHAGQLSQIKREETTKLKQQLSLQLKEFDDANTKLKSLHEKRKTIANDFKSLIDAINTPTKKNPEELTVLDISAAQTAAKDALQSGDIERANNAIQNAKEILQSLSQAGSATKSYLVEQAKRTALLADEIVGAEIQSQEQNISRIKQTMAELKAQAEWLKVLAVGFDVNGALKSADDMKNAIQQQMSKNPLKISAVVIPGETAIDARAEKMLAPQKRARGGFIQGPGTSMSDSILARLSSGEFVIRAAAVKRYGLGLFNQLNSMDLPKYARGGLVLPSVPAIQSKMPSSNQIASLTLNLGSDNFKIQTSNVDVVQALTKAIAKEALKSGRKQ